MSTSNITAIVNIFKRPHVLAEQIAAIKAQTIPPAKIMIWNNGNKVVDLSSYKADPQCLVFDNNFNSGVWSRFIIASLAPTEFVCIFDDDTIPGPRWFENCMEQMTRKEALYGTIGVLFSKLHMYDFSKRYGWDGPADEPKYVDIVGHSWFFKRSWITDYYLREQPQIYTKISNGEDLHFSFMLQKYANIQTIVPPHPRGDLSRWGSMPKTAWAIGCDGNSETGAHYPINAMFCEGLAAGFRIFIQRQVASSSGDIDFFLQKIRSRTPFAVIRPGDDEYHILQNRSLTTIDSWHFERGDKLNEDLAGAIQLASDKSCHVGIPCEVCNRSMAEYYLNTFKLHPNYTTFANLFVNANWEKWISFLKDEAIPFVLVGPNFREGTGFIVQKYVPIDPLLVNKWNTERDATLARFRDMFVGASRTIFLICGGPIAKILVAQGWAANPTNIYIDAGSSLDFFMKGSSNRAYTHRGAGCAVHDCKFTPSLIRI